MPSNKRLVGLRLDEPTHKMLEQLAREDRRSIAAMAELLFFRGLDALLADNAEVRKVEIKKRNRRT